MSSRRRSINAVQLCLAARFGERPAMTQVGVIASAADAGWVVLEVDFKVRVFLCMGILFECRIAKAVLDAYNLVVGLSQKPSQKAAPQCNWSAAFMFWFGVSGQIRDKPVCGL